VACRNRDRRWSQVSIQLVFPASGEEMVTKSICSAAAEVDVSVQLVSPMSGKRIPRPY
jgi:hypothetical protein